MSLHASLRSMSALSFAQGRTHWGYEVPVGHTITDLSQVPYWKDAADLIHPGDWLFAVHSTPEGTYNVIYAFANSPYGIYAQSMLSSVPPVGYRGGVGRSALPHSNVPFEPLEIP